MKYLLGLILLVSVSATAQYSPTAAKTRFVNGIGLGTKDTLAMNAADTVAMIVGRDSLVYFRYKGYWKPLAYNSSLGSYVKYTDTASMLSGYLPLYLRTAPTTVNINNKYFNIYGQNAAGAYTSGRIDITGELSSVGYQKNGSSYGLQIDTTGTAYFISHTQKPINYLSDYSANFTTNSLITKGYISTGYVPYTGATSAIDLNAKTVVNISKLGINTTTVPTILLRVIGDNNSTSRIAMRGYSSDANSSSIRVTKFRGTFASPQAPLSGDNLGKFELAGYGTTSSDGYPQATFEGLATENWGATARGAKVQFKVTPNTTTTQAIALTINQDKTAVFESSVTGTSLIKTGGTSSQYLMADGSTSTLTNPVTGTGTSGQVAYFNGTNSITSNAAFAFTPTTQLLVNNSVTAASSIARGGNITSTLTAAANSDVLVGLDINPTFTNGAFTGVSNYGIRMSSGSGIAFTNTNTQVIKARTQGLQFDFSGGVTGYWNSDGQIQPVSISTGGFVAGITSGLATLSAAGNALFRLNGNATSNAARVEYQQAATTKWYGGINTNSDFSITTDGGAANGIAIFQSTKNVSIGNATDNGTDKLQVTGSALFSSSVTANALLVNTTAARNMLGISSTALPTSGAEEGVAVIKTNSALWQLSTVGYLASSKGVRFYNNGGTGYTALEVVQAGGTRFIIDGGGLSAFSNSLAIGFGTTTTAPTNGLAVNSTITIGGTSASGSQKLTVIGASSGVIAGFTNGVNDLVLDLTSGVSLLTTQAGALSLGATSTEGLRMFAATRNVQIQNGGTFTDVASSILTLSSTTKGFLPPRMTTTQKNAISSPATGLMVYDTTLNKLCVYTGSAWETVTSL